MRTPASVPTIVVISALPGLFTLIGFSGWIVGPRSLVRCSIVGFLGAIASLAFASKRVTWPPGQKLAPFLGRLELVLGAIAVLSVITMFATCRLDGVADFPALAWQPVYELNNHGHRVAVSRVRYVLASTSFATGWHGMALLLTVEAFRKRFGIGKT